MPLPIHLKTFFSNEKKFGSKDRKWISEICFQYFRCALLFQNQTISVDEAIIRSVYLCSTETSDFLHAVSPHLNEDISDELSSKLKRLGADSATTFLYAHLLSEAIDKPAFALSLYKQPLFFLRCRPGKKDHVRDVFISNNIAFKEIGDDAIALKNNVPIDQYVKLNKEVVVQDLSSQKVFDFLKNVASVPKEVLNVWDVCAASGGKSILLFDRIGRKVNITVSDIRDNILFNLTKRFQEAGIPIFHKFTQDVAKKSGMEKGQEFDIIICDVPCTGSGTWARAPEQYKSFDPNQLTTFNIIQTQITQNALPHLKKGGLLFYVTCSVFTIENESVINEIAQNNKAVILHSEYVKGYDSGADTMFVAVLTL